MEEQVILVNEEDNFLGLCPKMEAHQKGFLHRAFSVFIFNDKGEMMLQRRAKEKYHSPKKWTNTSCSHQRKGETNINAGKRRLLEEMGFVSELQELTSFIYRAELEGGLVEHELDHILLGKHNGKPNPNPKEVDDWKWMPLNEIKKEIEMDQNDNYTVWFKIIMNNQFENFKKYLNGKSL